MAWWGKERRYFIENLLAWKGKKESKQRENPKRKYRKNRDSNSIQQSQIETPKSVLKRTAKNAETFTEMESKKREKEIAHTLNCCKTRTAFLYWRRWWEQLRHRKERKVHKLSSKAHFSVSRRSLACWSCSLFSSVPLFPFPFPGKSISKNFPGKS